MFFAHYPKRAALFGWLGAIAILLIVGALVATPDSPVRPVTESRQARGGRPTRCATCHQKIVETMLAAPHLNTLTWAGDERVLERFGGKSLHDTQTQATFQFQVKDEQLWCLSSLASDPVRVHWIFGSGSHAQTPAALFENAEGKPVMLQHRVSWYPQAGLALTLGADDEAVSHGGSLDAPPTRIGLEGQGDWQTRAETIACFRCHSSSLNPDRLLEKAGVQSGLGCVRCHINAASHADQQEGATVASKMVGWKALSARQHIDRCGECHRRADQTPQDEITPEANHIVRFAPVGLVQSRCFQESEVRSDMRLDCLTCHDPHRPAERDPAFYAAKCLSCHERDDTAPCSVEPQSLDCTRCHMPKRETQRFLSFTDHWIQRSPATLNDASR